MSDAVRNNYGAEGYDSVRCNQCMEYVGVLPKSDTCPVCGFNGALMDDPPLTFPFGETPEEVIRERLAYCVAAEALAEPADALANWFSNMPQWQFAGDPDNLFTVLDALEDVAWDELEAWERGPERGRMSIDDTRAGVLRISILAALGINEGGE